MNLFSLMATLGLDSSEYEKKMADAEKKTGAMGSAVSKVGGVIKKAAIPLAIGAIGKSAIETGMTFEASMSQVAATMGMSSEQIKNGSKDFELLKNAAKEAGSTTKFTATESAEALNYLALAGYDAKTAAETLPTVLNLAAAGGMDLAYASDLVTDSMSALGKPASEVVEFTDQLAKTSQKSNTNVAQLGEAILTVGGTAKIMAGGTVEMNTQLGILADNGIKGAEGGTALRNVLLSLSAPTDKAAKLMKEMGLNAYDANGNLRPTNEIFQDLNKILGTMSQEERTNVLNQLFNKVDLKAANALLANSGKRFNELSTEIANSQGAADTMAKTMSDNLQGALTTLGSAFDGLKTEIYETFGETAKNFVNAFATGVQKLTQAFKEGKLDGILNAIGAALAGIITYITLIKGYAIVTGIIAVVKPLMTALTMVKSLSGAMAILNTVMMANPIGLIIAGIAALVAAFVYLWNTTDWFKNMWIGIWEAIKGIFSGALELIKAGWENLINFPNYCAQKMEEFRAIWAEKWQAIKDFFSGIWDGIRGLWQSVLDWFGRLGQAIVDLAQRWAQGWQNILAKIGEVVGNIIAFFAQLPGKIWNIFVQVIQKTTTWVYEMGRKGAEAGKELFNAVWDAIKTLPSKVLELGSKIPQMLWDGIKNAGAWLGNTVKGWVKGLFSFGNIFLSAPEAQNLALNAIGGANAFNMSLNGARGIQGAGFGGLTSNTNVSLNIGGKEFDKLVIRTVTTNYDKIENIIQQKSRGRR